MCRCYAIGLILVAILMVSACSGEDPKIPSKTSADNGWTELFDGRSLAGWKETDFGGQGRVEVRDGSIVMGIGATLTGITYTGELPKDEYEIEVEAMRLEGHDFFSTITFPVRESWCSFVTGGWGGSLVGLSSLEGNDASSNETSRQFDFEDNRWYRFRVRVGSSKIQAWIDEKQMVDVDTTDRSVGIRPEVSLSRPFGLCTWQTKGAVRAVRLRKLQ